MRTAGETADATDTEGIKDVVRVSHQEAADAPLRQQIEQANSGMMTERHSTVDRTVASTWSY
jgi:hypothetical protein